jgi:hypothetical protein
MLISRRSVLHKGAAWAGGLACGAISRAAFAQNPAALPAVASTSPSAIRMENGTAQAGLDFTLRNSAAGRKYQVETLPGGLAVIDFDSDGWPDLFCTNGAALPSLVKSGPEYWNRLYRNNRDGTFSDCTQKAGLEGRGYNMGVAVGDYNNDGHEDLFVAGVHANFLYRNNGDGTFSDVTTAAGLAAPPGPGMPLWSVGACWIDYNNDGYLDLFISNYCDWEPGSDPVCGGVQAGSRAYCHPDRYRAERMQLYHNNGDGTFTQITEQLGLPDVLGKGMGLAIADFAGDGSPGIFIANDNARNLLLRNRTGRLETGRQKESRVGFDEVGVDAGVAYNGDGRNISGMGADFGDIDGDGRPDIVMTGLKNETYEVFLNRGHGTFDDGSTRTGLLNLSRKWNGWGCGLADLDNDGWLDLFVAGGGLDVQDAQSNRIFRNAAGRFEDVTASVGSDFQQAALHRGVVFADFDRDGRIDAAVSALNAPIELWWNRTPRDVPARHWLQVKLHGRKSNRSAIGAEVRCQTGTRRQVRTVSGSMGYGSTSELAVHFGLGEATRATLEIRWPSGRVQSAGETAVDRRMEITEALD